MNLVRTLILLAAMTALFLGVGFLLGGEGGLVIAFVAAIAMNAFAYWNSATMVLRMHKAREVDERSAPEFYAMVRDLASRAGLPMPKVYIIDTDQPNAFATGRSPENAAVAATSGIMRTLTREELAGVMAHELAHVQNRDTLIMTVAATIAGAIGFVSQFAFFFRGGDNRPNPLLAIALMIFAPLAAAIVQMAISRTREFAADQRGAEICGRPDWLASALRKIEAAARGRTLPSAERHPSTAHMFILNPLSGRGVSQLFRTHPPTEQRIAKLLQLPRDNPSSGHRDIPSTGPWNSSRHPRRGGSVPAAGRR